MGKRSQVTTFEINKKWSDAFLVEIKSILGMHLIGQAPTVEDVSRNTDLITLTMLPVRISCRVRRPGYFEKYGDEFTIRSDVKMEKLNSQR
jgi:hypothetical protein